MPGFPSLFFMYGPNTNTSGGSIIFYEETQAAYIRQALQRVRGERRGGDRGARRRSRPPATASCRLGSPGRRGLECDSWYRDRHRPVVTNWPGYMRDYDERLRTLDPNEYELIPAAERQPVAA